MLNPLTQYLMIGKALLILGLVGALCLMNGQIHKWHLQSDRNAAKAQLYEDALNDISTKRNEQQVVTRDKLRVVTRLVHDADGVAKKIESAPPTEGCKTSPAIMGADL